MCNGPLLTEGIPSSSLFVSHALDWIELDSRKPWVAERNLFFFRFQFRERVVRPGAKIHLLFPVHAEDVSCRPCPAPLCRQITGFQCRCLADAEQKFERSPSTHVAADPSTAWVLGDIRQARELFPCVPTESTFAAGLAALRLACEKSVAADPAVTERDYRVTYPVTDLAHAEIPLNGSYEEGQGFSVICDLKNNTGIQVGPNGGKAAFYYCARTLLDDLSDATQSEEVHHLIQLGANIVPVAVLQVLLLSPRNFVSLTPSYDGHHLRRPYSNPHRSPDGKVFKDSRMFLLLRADDATQFADGKGEFPFDTQWEVEPQGELDNSVAGPSSTKRQPTAAMTPKQSESQVGDLSPSSAEDPPDGMTHQLHFAYLKALRELSEQKGEGTFTSKDLFETVEKGSPSSTVKWLGAMENRGVVEFLGVTRGREYRILKLPPQLSV